MKGKRKRKPGFQIAGTRKRGKKSEEKPYKRGGRRIAPIILFHGGKKKKALEIYFVRKKKKKRRKVPVKASPRHTWGEGDRQTGQKRGKVGQGHKNDDTPHLTLSGLIERPPSLAEKKKKGKKKESLNR